MSYRQHGFNLLEMMIVLAIAAIALGVAVPSFQESIVSARTRNIAESIQSGLLLARSEAIKRNAPMRFQLVSALDATCTASASSRYWLVTQYTSVTNPVNSRGVPTGQCGVAAYLPPDQEEPCPATTVYTVSATSAASCQADPFIAFKSGNENATNVSIAASPTMGGSPANFVVTFGPLGQLLANLEGAVPAASATGVTYTALVSPSTGISGRSWRVQVNSNGNVRLCDPLAAAGSATVCL